MVCKPHNNMNTVEYTDTKFPDNTKSKYDLISKRLLLNGKPTKAQAISYKGQFMGAFGLGYTVVAHEDLYNTAERIAKKFNCVAQPTQSTKKQRWWHKADFGNAELSETGGQMIATFLDEGNGVDVTGEGDWVKAGFTIKGSIDGSSATKIFPATERKFCFNRMYHLASVGEVHNETIRTLNAEIQKDEEDLNLMKIRWNHSKNFRIEDFADSIEGALNNGKKLLEKYQTFKNTKITQAMADDIHESLGKRFAKELDWLEIDKDEVKLSAVDKWKAFNDITRRLTHDDISKSMAGILNRYKQVDRIFTEEPLVITQ